MGVISLAPGPKVVQYELAKLVAAAVYGTLPFRSDFLDIARFPMGSLHLYGTSLVGLQVDVEITNVPTVGYAEVIATNVAANKVVVLNQGAKFVQFNLKALTSGLFGATYSGATPS